VREKAYLEFDETKSLLGGFGDHTGHHRRKTAEEALRRTEEERKVAEAGARGAPAAPRRAGGAYSAIVLLCSRRDYQVASPNAASASSSGESEGRRCYEYCFGQTAPCKFCQTTIPSVSATGKPGIGR